MNVASIHYFDKDDDDAPWYCWACCKRKNIKYEFDIDPLTVQIGGKHLVALDASCQRYRLGMVEETDGDTIRFSFSHQVRGIVDFCMHMSNKYLRLV